ncbi:T9SS type B sorting domain-containing protein [Kordia sp.]|uniref:T9SS type B sorting domain-containing protein n=1 Tax=Kordia sp. TaxID=1965332 RepID=UPI0025C41262|nr:T9SS type B sorting domain-containing protein [Kordia sp.]MCH2195561.1 T9SS type B sorting domain-containing protein [Kordia sp.]
MKKYYKFVFSALFFCVNVAFGQGEGVNWYFGSNAGLDFTTSPPTALLDGALETNEGVATISSQTGQLLFYTDGRSVWDRNHQVTPNGTGLTGDSSSSQSAIIVPKPGDPNIYYIFTVDNEAGLNGLRYSEFDLTLNSGNGDVTSLKNVPLWPSTAEKITAVQHANGTDYWVLSHAWANNTFLVFQVTAAGVNTTPITQDIGAIHSGNTTEAIGYMKASSNGEKLAVAQWSNDSFVEIFDFNDANGTISNPILLDNIFFVGEQNGSYGVEFSPNTEFLYVSDLKFNPTVESKVHQFNITSWNQADILASDVILYEGPDILGAIQLAVDEKLYVANGGVAFLDVIENPNVAGTGAGYLNRGISLQGRLGRFGLPTFIQSFFVGSIQFENICLGEETNFTLNTSETVTSVAWNFGDGNSSTDLNPVHLYANPGTYSVTVSINVNGEIRDTTRDITIYEIPVAGAISDYLLCDDVSNNQIETFDLSTKITEALAGQSDQLFSVAFYASQEDADTDQNRLPLSFDNTSNNQEIFARVFNLGQSGCFDITSFTLIVNPLPMANPIDNIDICDDQSNNGFEVINLNQFDPEVLQSQTASDFVITYHLTQQDADNDIGALATNFQTIDNPQQIVVRIEAAGNATCYDTTSFEITITSAIIANEVDGLFECSFLDNPNTATFNLTTQNALILDGLTGTYGISYHLSETDAMMNIAPISSIYTNTENPQQIYVRVEDTTNSSCFDIVDFAVTALERPIVADDETLYLCTDGTVALPAGVDADFYNWSNGATSETIIVDTAGTYTVEIGNSFTIFGEQQNCSNTRTFTVIESGPATAIDVTITDWTNTQNTIAVAVQGLGNYEYSLDGITYTNSNLFEFLLAGEYTMYVRDKNNCGIVTEPVFLLNYPRFFTPNNDGFNDNWQIVASSSDPTLRIYIFDRYGKRLTTLNPASKGWDGNYNGQRMPSGDYWFRVERPMIGTIYKGHFTLKR